MPPPSLPDDLPEGLPSALVDLAIRRMYGHIGGKDDASPLMADYVRHVGHEQDFPLAGRCPVCAKPLDDHLHGTVMCVHLGP